jgi:hypothetical protein
MVGAADGNKGNENEIVYPDIEAPGETGPNTGDEPDSSDMPQEISKTHAMESLRAAGFEAS